MKDDLHLNKSIKLSNLHCPDIDILGKPILHHAVTRLRNY